MKRSSASNRGFTLMEVLVASGLLCLCLALAGSVLLSGLSLYGTLERDSEAQASCARAFAMLRRDFQALVPGTEPSTNFRAEGVEKGASWKAASKEGARAVSYFIRDGSLVRSVDGNEAPLLSGMPVHFEMKLLDSRLGWISLRYGNQTLSQHVRIRNGETY